MSAPHTKATPSKSEDTGKLEANHRPEQLFTSFCIKLKST